MKTFRKALCHLNAFAIGAALLLLTAGFSGNKNGESHSHLSTGMDTVDHRLTVTLPDGGKLVNGKPVGKKL